MVLRYLAEMSLGVERYAIQAIIPRARAAIAMIGGSISGANPHE
jgi:hypothetical protein